MKYKYLVPIVGVQHYVDNYDKFTAELARGTEVIVKKDTNNPYAPRVFSAFIDYRQVGTIGRNYIDECEALMNEKGTLHAQVEYGERKTIYIVVSDPDEHIPDYRLRSSYKPRLTDDPLPLIAPLRIPEWEQQLDMRSEGLLREFDTINSSAGSMTEPFQQHMAQWLTHYRGCQRRTLSREDTMMAKQLEMRDYGYQGDFTEAYRQYHVMYHEVLTISNHLTQADGCLEAMHYQLAQQREHIQQPGELLDQYQRVYLRRVTPELLHSERDRLEDWLCALPYAIYSRYSDSPAKLASNLFYTQFSRPELYMIYKVLLVIEHLDTLLKTEEQSATKPSTLDIRQTPSSKAQQLVEKQDEQAKNLIKIIRHLISNGFGTSSYNIDVVTHIMERLLFVSTIPNDKHSNTRSLLWNQILKQKSTTRLAQLRLNYLLHIIGMLLKHGLLVGEVLTMAKSIYHYCCQKDEKFAKIVLKDKMIDRLRSYIQRGKAEVLKGDLAAIEAMLLDTMNTP